MALPEHTAFLPPSSVSHFQLISSMILGLFNVMYTHRHTRERLLQDTQPPSFSSSGQHTQVKTKKIFKNTNMTPTDFNSFK